MHKKHLPRHSQQSEKASISDAMHLEALFIGENVDNRKRLSALVDQSRILMTILSRLIADDYAKHYRRKAIDLSSMNLLALRPPSEEQVAPMDNEWWRRIPILAASIQHVRHKDSRGKRVSSKNGLSHSIDGFSLRATPKLQSYVTGNLLSCLSKLSAYLTHLTIHRGSIYIDLTNTAIRPLFGNVILKYLTVHDIESLKDDGKRQEAYLHGLVEPIKSCEGWLL